MFGFGVGELLAIAVIVLAVFGSTSLRPVAQKLGEPHRPRPAELRFVRAPRLGSWTRGDWARMAIAILLGLAAAWATFHVQRPRAATGATASDYVQFLIDS